MTEAALAPLVEETLGWLEAERNAEERDGLARYGIPTETALGIPMRVLKAKGKALGRDHELARGLWATGLYEARTLAVFVANPALMSASEADDWAADFDSWAICDTACFHLFDRTPFAWRKPAPWAMDERLYVRRAGFALIWALALHDKTAPDGAFLDILPLARDAATDERPHVTKAIDMALRAIGRRTQTLNTAVRTLCDDLKDASGKPERWIGRHAGKDLTSDKVLAKL